MEKNLKKNIYICITESLCYIPETLKINYILIKKLKVKKREGKMGTERKYHLWMAYWVPGRSKH